MNTAQLSVEIELAQPRDMEPIWELYEKIWLQAYPNKDAGISRDDIAKYLAFERPGMTKRWQAAIARPGDVNNNQRAVFVARANDAIVGMVSPKVNDDGTHRLTSLYVAPDTRGQGVGSKLIKHVLHWHEGHDVYLYVAPYLQGAQRLYQKHGFDFIEIPLTYFKNDPVPHLTMMRPRPV
jgi:ribosomal protein S18 acetylase RimI-like enzyme